jgi:fructokinase
MIDVLGEALVDAHDDGDVVRAYPGGGPFNTAIGLARLGVPVTFRGALSSDPFGDVLQQALGRAGVGVGCPGRVDAPTPLALVTRRADGEAVYRFHLTGTAFERTAEQIRLSATAAAVFVGSLALGLDPPGERVAELAVAASARCALVVDPNVRPALLERVEARGRLERLVAVATLVKLSRADCDWLYPAAKPDETARRFLGLGAACVVVTDGAAGAAGWTREALVRVEAPRVAVVDTVGAGDAFTAGFLARLWQAGRLSRAGALALAEHELEEALAYGAAAGAAQCERASAWGPTPADVERLLARTTRQTVDTTQGG